MGNQNAPSHNSNNASKQVKYIRPAPGYRGMRVFRKHTVHVYDKQTNAI
jgi:hypothetical protein